MISFCNYLIELINKDIYKQIFLHNKNALKKKLVKLVRVNWNIYPQKVFTSNKNDYKETACICA